MKNPSKRNKITAIILYLLPILFFIVSYFLITTSGEDIFQGANNFRTGAELNPLQDAINAFSYNSRITDMYAWTVIDFFDYQFAFGPDLIFRLIDVVLASAVFYFTTYLILNHKPKLLIKDALIFCATFLVFIITPFGRTFYIEFSMIHNYVPLALITLIFAIPYLRLLTKNPIIGHQKLLNIVMPILGLYFGMAATITPLAFLITVIIYCLINHKNLTRPPVWFFTGLAGTVIGFTICWFAGSGVDHYTARQAATFDYIAIADLLSAPFEFIPKILWHEVYNFGIVLLPLLGIFVAGYIFSKPKVNFKKLGSETKKLVLVFSIFIIIHILGASLIKAPFRLLIPAYLAGIIIIFRIFAERINSKIIGVIVATFTVAVLLAHTILLVKYHQQAGEILTEIKNSPTETLCVEKERTVPDRLRFIDLSQANFLVNWGYPEPIYGKNITFCE